MKFRLVLAAAPFILTSLVAHAQTVKPGLWEHSFKMKTQSGQMEAAMAQVQQQMASMPPEQRKMMEQMLASQGVGLGAKGQSVKVCITPEMAAKQDLPQQDGDCKQEILQRSAKSMKFKFTCKGTDGRPPTFGEGEVNFVSPTAYTSKSVINTSIEGKPERMNMDMAGNWLSGDCGNIKPPKLDGR